MREIERTIDAELEQIVQVAATLVNDPAANNHNQSRPDGGNTTNPTSEDENMDFDSDDELDDDDESKSNHSNGRRRGGGSSASGTREPKCEGKRRHHNVLERKRRDLIKDSFSKLKDSIPTLHQERASRAQILKKAADYIQVTMRRNEAHRLELAKLESENRKLEEENKLNLNLNVNLTDNNITTSTASTTTTHLQNHHHNAIKLKKEQL